MRERQLDLSRRNMKKNSSFKNNTYLNDMRKKYDFSGGVRGKYAKNLRENGYIIRIYDDDGTFTETQVLGTKPKTKTFEINPNILSPIQRKRKNIAIDDILRIITKFSKSSRIDRKIKSEKYAKV